MSIFTMIFIVSILGAVIGVKKPWLGGLPGLLVAPLLLYFSPPLNMIPIIIKILFLFSLGLSYGFMSSIIFSGLKGRGQSVGRTFRSGFGVHHPGGIILSDDEHKILEDQDIKREVIFSF